MQYYNNISDAEYLKAAHKMNMEENSKDQKIKEAALLNEAAERREAANEYIAFMQESADNQYKAGNFFSNVKNTLLSLISKKLS